MSTEWEPLSIRTPPPETSGIAFQRSVIETCAQKAFSYSSEVAEDPGLDERLGLDRRRRRSGTWRPSSASRPAARSAATTSSCASSLLMVSGFSQSTCLPCSRSAGAISAWWLGRRAHDQRRVHRVQRPRGGVVVEVRAAAAPPRGLARGRTGLDDGGQLGRVDRAEGRRGGPGRCGRSRPGRSATGVVSFSCHRASSRRRLRIASATWSTCSAGSFSLIGSTTTRPAPQRARGTPRGRRRPRARPPVGALVGELAGAEGVAVLATPAHSKAGFWM